LTEDDKNKTKRKRFGVSVRFGSASKVWNFHWQQRGLDCWSNVHMCWIYIICVVILGV